MNPSNKKVLISAASNVAAAWHHEIGGVIDVKKNLLLGHCPNIQSVFENVLRYKKLVGAKNG